MYETGDMLWEKKHTFITALGKYIQAFCIKMEPRLSCGFSCEKGSPTFMEIVASAAMNERG